MAAPKFRQRRGGAAYPPDRASHPRADRGIIRPGAGIGDLRKPLTECQSRVAIVCIELGQQSLVILDIDNGGDKGMVLGGGADHRRATDVDILDAGVIVATLGNRFFERVEIDHQKVDRLDVMREHCRDMIVIVTQGQQPAMHHRVQRFDPAIHHLGKSRHLGHVLDRHIRITQRLGGPAGGQDLDPPRIQRLGKIDEAGFVRHGKQGASQGGKSGHGSKNSQCSVQQHRIVLGQVPHRDGGILRLGQRPANAGRILHCATG